MSINLDPDYNAYTETIAAQRELIVQERKRNRYKRCCYGFLTLLSYVLVGFVSTDGTIIFCSKHNCTIPTIYNSSIVMVPLQSEEGIHALWFREGILSIMLFILLCYRMVFCLMGTSSHCLSRV
jgi:hypothetical protein